jgi:hypothetical protein
MNHSGNKFPKDLLARVRKNTIEFRNYSHISSRDANHSFNIYWPIPLIYSFDFDKLKILGLEYYFLMDNHQEILKFCRDIISKKIDKKMIIEKEIYMLLPEDIKKIFYTYEIFDNREKPTVKYIPDYSTLNLQDIKDLSRFELIRNYNVAKIGTSTLFLQLILKLAWYSTYSKNNNEDNIVRREVLTPYHDLVILNKVHLN